MSKLTQVLSTAALVAVFGSNVAVAQQPAQRTNVRGTIETVDGNTMKVKTREGQDVSVALPDNVSVRGVVKVPLSDVKVGSYIGVSAMPQADGTQRALHIHIFPEAMRGTAEGNRPYDLRPGSTMTNAAVETTVSGVNGQTIKVKYPNGEKTFIVPPDAPIVAFVPGRRDELKAGAKVVLSNAVKEPDGSVQAAAVNVGRDGLTPPM